MYQPRVLTQDHKRPPCLLLAIARRKHGLRPTAYGAELKRSGSKLFGILIMIQARSARYARV